MPVAGFSNMQLSVICPVYNTRTEDLRAAVKSVLDQENGKQLQLILVDDCSTAPHIPGMLADLARRDPRVTVVRCEKNGGPAAARNLGLSSATGDWIGFIDADDLWPVDKLAKAEALLIGHPDARWIVSACAVLDKSGALLPESVPSVFNAPDVRGFHRCGGPALTRSIILEGLHLGACLIHRSLLGALRFETRASYGEDILFLAKLSLAGEAYAAGGTGYILRRQHASMMWSSNRLSARYASGHLVALRDPALRGFRREYRWALYSVFKDVALNNLMNGRNLAGLLFAFRAYLLDPREISDFVYFVRLLFVTDRIKRALRAPRYSSCEHIFLDRLV
jgi:glycosyltransferase involved in cell wall biosynthesis